MLVEAARRQRSEGTSQRRILLLASIWSLTLILILPAVLRWKAPPLYPRGGHLVTDLVYLVVAGICFLIYRAERRTLPWTRVLALIIMLLVLSSIVNNVHSFDVDHATNYYSSNGGWQNQMQNYVIQLSPAVLPHSYRFLPNAIVRWIQLAGLDYEPARDLYRLIFGLLLFYALYRYARLYTTFSGAVLALALVSAVFPVSFELYAGQLADPISHLSFVLALIFLETGDFALLLTTLLIGSLAKETVLALAGYYVLFGSKDTNYRAKALVLCLSCLAVYLGVRFFVLHGQLSYNQISGVTLAHLKTNWIDKEWRPRFLLTAAAFLPFLLLNWKATPLALKRQALFLLPVLFVSGLFFSWLHEARNFMPLVFVLAVVTARYFQSYTAHPAYPEKLIN